MKVCLSWQDLTTQNHQTLTLDLPVAIGRKQSDIPNEFEGKKITPLILENDSISRCHGFIFARNDQILFCDTSRYGSTQAVQSGDLIKLGEYQIQLDSVSNPVFDSMPTQSIGLVPQETKTIQFSASRINNEEWLDVPVKSINFNDRNFLSSSGYPET